MNANHDNNFIQRFWRALAAAGAPLRGRTIRREKRLRLCETLSLGEKRFLAVVQVEHQQFLVGGAGGSISLLTELPAASGETGPGGQPS